MTGTSQLTETAARRLLDRNAIYAQFFDDEADRLAAACSAMAERFRRGHDDRLEETAV